MPQSPPTIRRPFELFVSTTDQLASLLDCEPAELVRLIRDAPDLYTMFQVPKSSGGFREIRPPSRRLRDAQRRLLSLLSGRVRYPRWMMGGVPGRSIFDHARPHVGMQAVATFDVQKFYPSTTAAMVRTVLELLGVHDAAADAVVRLVTKDNQLPQGGPTSGFLANLVLDPADRRIDAICRKHKLAFTRYVDDVAISGNCALQGFQGAIVDAIEACGYTVAPNKIHYMGRSVPQIVTMLRVNDSLRPTREFVQEVNETIWLCLNHGAVFAAAVEGVSVNGLKNRLTGRVGHIAQADARLGKKLKGRLFGVNWRVSTPGELLAA